MLKRLELTLTRFLLSVGGWVRPDGTMRAIRAFYASLSYFVVLDGPTEKRFAATTD